MSEKSEPEVVQESPKIPTMTPPPMTETTPPEPKVILEYKDERGRGLKLLTTGQVIPVGYEADEVSLEIFQVLLAQFSILSGIQQNVQELIKLDLKGVIKLITTSEERNLEAVEMLRERLVQANRSYVIDVRRRAGEPSR